VKDLLRATAAFALPPPWMMNNGCCWHARRTSHHEGGKDLFIRSFLIFHLVANFQNIGTLADDGGRCVLFYKDHLCFTDQLSGIRLLF
jgi:hypothetical protein